MNAGTAQAYYHTYFKQQYPGIATPSHIVTPKYATQEQIKQVIRYIVNDKMTITAASRKAKMSRNTATRHHRQYLIDNNMEILVHRYTKPYSQEQKSELIRHIVDNKMSVNAASKKVNMYLRTAYKYYYRYRKDQKRDGLT
jgi:hypothetical protein